MEKLRRITITITLPKHEKKRDYFVQVMKFKGLCIYDKDMILAYNIQYIGKKETFFAYATIKES